MSVPFEINYVPDEVNKELWEAFTQEKEKYVQAGPENYSLTPKYMGEAAGLYNMEVRPDDVWIVTFPRTGTTLTQEILWLINNDLDYDRARNEKLGQRFPFLESSILMPDHFSEELIKLNNMDSKAEEEYRKKMNPRYEKISKMESPRHIKTHLPFSLLPPKLIDTCKVVYVARNPKDVAVSCYYHNSYLKFIGFQGSFAKYWDLFQRGLIMYAPFWSHVEEAWRLRNHHNLLFLFYEDLKKDLPGALRRVAGFLNKSLEEEKIVKLVDHLRIENFRTNPSMADSLLLKGYANEHMPGFFRKGKSGTWREEFTPELNAKADEWIKEHEKHTDLRFKY